MIKAPDLQAVGSSPETSSFPAWRVRARPLRALVQVSGICDPHATWQPCPSPKGGAGGGIEGRCHCLGPGGWQGTEVAWEQRQREALGDGGCLQWSQLSCPSVAPSKSNLSKVPVCCKTSSPTSIPGEQPQKLLLTAKIPPVCPDCPLSPGSVPSRSCGWIRICQHE